MNDIMQRTMYKYALSQRQKFSTPTGNAIDAGVGRTAIEYLPPAFLQPHKVWFTNLDAREMDLQNTRTALIRGRGEIRGPRVHKTTSGGGTRCGPPSGWLLNFFPIVPDMLRSTKIHNRYRQTKLFMPSGGTKAI